MAALPRALDPRATRRAMRLSYAEGAVYAMMVGFAEMYFVPDLVRLGGSPLEVAVLVGLPLACGSVGAVLGLRLLGRLRRARPVVVSGVVAQALVLIGLTLAETWQVTTPQLLIAAACAYHLCAQLVAGPWSAWLGDVVPVPIRGRYFSGRNRAVHLTSFVALLVGGLILQWLEPRLGTSVGGRGFAVLFGVAATARLVSAALMSNTPEGRAVLGPDPRFAVPLRPRWSAPSDRLVLGAGLLYFAVYFSSPFFTPYMLEELRFDYAEFTLATAAMVAFQVLSLRRWGQSVDRFGAVAVYRLAIVMLALVPLPWLVLRGFAGICAAQALSGFAWAAHEIAFFTLMLESTDPVRRPRTYALQSVCIGSGQLLGSLVGGAVFLVVLDARVVFGISSGLRVVAAVGLALALAEVFRRAKIGRRGLLLRVMGFRPSGGAVHRPMVWFRTPTTPSPDEDGADDRLDPAP